MGELTRAEASESTLTTGSMVRGLYQSDAGSTGTTTVYNQIPIRQMAPRVRAFRPPSILEEALERSPREAHGRAVLAAAMVLQALSGATRTPHRIVVTRAGSVAIMYFEDRRYATLECDEDGDVVLVLSDRRSTAETVADIVDLSNMYETAASINDFLRR